MLENILLLGRFKHLRILLLIGTIKNRARPLVVPTCLVISYFLEANMTPQSLCQPRESCGVMVEDYTK